MTDPIKLYAWPTPNGYKISIMLEECGLPYEVIPVDITNGDQHQEAFRKLNPNGKMPVIVDPDGPDGKSITIFESGAILAYLGEKTGEFFPSGIRERVEVGQWLMWQMAGFGPMLGQAHHFRQYAPEHVEYAYNRYTKESDRLYGVLNDRLENSAFAGGAEYSIADMAIYPWALSHENQGVNLADHPYVAKWMKIIAERPAVQKGLAFMDSYKTDSRDMNEEQHKQLFGT